MQGEGFLQSDTVALISETAANNTYALPLASVTKQSADIVMPKISSPTHTSYGSNGKQIPAD